MIAKLRVYSTLSITARNYRFWKFQSSESRARLKSAKFSFVHMIAFPLANEIKQAFYESIKKLQAFTLIDLSLIVNRKNMHISSAHVQHTRDLSRENYSNGVIKQELLQTVPRDCSLTN